MGEKEEYVLLTIKYGIGYGQHTTDMEVPADASEDEIAQMIFEMLSERLDFSWERESRP